MAVFRDGTIAPITAGIPQAPEDQDTNRSVPRSRDVLVNALASLADVEPEALDDALDELGKPRVMGLYDDPAEKMLRQSYAARGQVFPGDNPYAAWLPQGR